MIRGDARWKTRWDVWIAVLIVYSIIIVPVRVAFAWRPCILQADWWWDLIVDTCFAVDIVLCFRTAPIVDAGARNQQILITSAREIAHRYLCGWFIIDILSTIPVDTIVDVAAFAETGSVQAVCDGTAGMFRSIQVIRILRLVRLLKLFRFLKLGHHIKRWEDQLDANPAYLRFARLLLVVLFLSHLFACLWFAMYSFSSSVVDSAGRNDSSSSSSSSSVESIGTSPNWIRAYAEQQLTEAAHDAVLYDATTQYLSSMYWAFTTMTTVGYGDITPTNMSEMWFVITMEFAGLVVFGMAIASMTNILANFNMHKKLHRERMSVVNRYVRERGLTRRLQRRVRRFYEYYLERVSVFDVSGMLEEISQSLKNDLCASLFRDLVADLPFLQGRDAAFVALVGMQLQPFFALTGEYICRRGVISLEVYWIRSGRVQLRWGPAASQSLFLVNGQHFGQEVLASTDLKMRADVRAFTYCDLLYLAKDVLEVLFKTYPALLSELKQQLRVQYDAMAAMEAQGRLSGGGGLQACTADGGANSRAPSPPPRVPPPKVGPLRNSTGLSRAGAQAVRQKTMREMSVRQDDRPVRQNVVHEDAAAPLQESPPPPPPSPPDKQETEVGGIEDRPPAVEAPPSPLVAPVTRAETPPGAVIDSDRSSDPAGAPNRHRTVERKLAAARSCRMRDATPVKAMRAALSLVGSSRRSSAASRRSHEEGDGAERRSEEEDAERRGHAFTRAWAARKVKEQGGAARGGNTLRETIDAEQQDLEHQIQQMAALEVRERVRRRISEESYTGASLQMSPEKMRRVASLQKRESAADGGRRESAQWMSAEEEEQAERVELWRQHLIHPSAPMRTYWDMGLAVFVIYSILVVPMRIGFNLEATKDSFIFWFEVVIDLFFLLDIVVNLRTAHVRHDGMLETHSGRIALAYCRSWLLIDLTSSVPIDLILLGLEAQAGSAASDSNDGASPSRDIKGIKIVKGLRLIRLMKLLRLLKITKYLQTAQEELEVNPAVIELFSLAVRTLLLMHLAACVWHWTTTWQMPLTLSDLTEEAILAGVTLEQARVEAAMATWLQYFAQRLEDGDWPSVFERYTASMYWALTTMSTIGYGDIKSITNVERVVSIVIMLVGSVIFGIVVSGMQSLMEQINSVRHRATEKMDQVKAMLRERGVPRELVRKTTHYYQHFLLECNDVTTEQRILEELCPPLRTELLLFLNAEAVESIHFFRGQDPTFISSVCKMLKPCFFGPHDWIFREGELGLEMYFVQFGSVDMICYVNNQEVFLDNLSAGAYFGEVAILLDGLRREASARAATFCAMFSFTKHALSQLLAMYPDVSADMQAQMEARLRRWRLKRAMKAVCKMSTVSRLFTSAAKERKDSGLPKGMDDGARSAIAPNAHAKSSAPPSPVKRLTDTLRGMSGKALGSSAKVAPSSACSEKAAAPTIVRAPDVNDGIEQALQMHEALRNSSREMTSDDTEADGGDGNAASGPATTEAFQSSD